MSNPVNARMTHRCTVERDSTIGTVSAIGAKNPPDWQSLHANQSCFFWMHEAREIITDKGTVIAEAEMLLPLGLDIKESDRVTGVSVISGIFEVIGVTWRHTHLEAMMKRAS